MLHNNREGATLRIGLLFRSIGFEYIHIPVLFMNARHTANHIQYFRKSRKGLTKGLS